MDQLFPERQHAKEEPIATKSPTIVPEPQKPRKSTRKIGMHAIIENDLEVQVLSSKEHSLGYYPTNQHLDMTFSQEERIKYEAIAEVDRIRSTHLNLKIEKTHSEDSLMEEDIEDQSFCDPQPDDSASSINESCDIPKSKAMLS